MAAGIDSLPSGARRVRRRLARMVGRGPQGPPTEAPAGPIGIKMELTYACNLRCGFCYTDSPRHTLARTRSLEDEQWRAVMEQALEAGVIEAVVTGGEPLMRRELTLEMIERMAGEGLGVTLNTNGWFVDREVAERIAAASGAVVNVSLDGARPGLHDESRGLGGAWRRAVEAIDHVLSAGAGLCVVHVLSRSSLAEFDAFLEQMAMLGVPYVRVVEVVPVGAAARAGEWSIDTTDVNRRIARFRKAHPAGPKIKFVTAERVAAGAAAISPPSSMLVRPNGDVRTDSLRPFTYGNVVEEGVSKCWEAMRDGWRNDLFAEWAGEVGGAEDLAGSKLVPYLDAEAPVSGSTAGVEGGRDANVPAPTVLGDATEEDDRARASALVRKLALGRRYSHQPIRVADNGQGAYVRRAFDGRFLSVNPAAAVALAALDGGSASDAAGALRSSFGLSGDQAEGDALKAVGELSAVGAIAPQGAVASAAQRGPGQADLPSAEHDPVAGID